MKILGLCVLVSLSACSTFYNRHYTKGIFYDGLAHKPRPAAHPENPTLPVPMQHAADSSQRIAHKHLPEEKIALQDETQQAVKPETRSSIAQKSIKPAAPFSSPFLKKVLKPVQNKIRASRHSNSVAGKAAFYILALVLAVGIMALAIYFLPAILIPAAASSTFSTILLLGAIIVVCIFAFLIYTLIHTLIDLFQHKKVVEEADF